MLCDEDTYNERAFTVIKYFYRSSSILCRTAFSRNMLDTSRYWRLEVGESVVETVNCVSSNW